MEEASSTWMQFWEVEVGLNSNVRRAILTQRSPCVAQPASLLTREWDPSGFQAEALVLIEKEMFLVLGPPPRNCLTLRKKFGALVDSRVWRKDSLWVILHLAVGQQDQHQAFS